MKVYQCINIALNFYGKTSLVKPAYAESADWSLVTRIVALFDRGRFTGVRRFRRFGKTGVEFGGVFFQVWRIAHSYTM